MTTFITVVVRISIVK